MRKKMREGEEGEDREDGGQKEITGGGTAVAKQERGKNGENRKVKFEEKGRGVQ